MTGWFAGFMDHSATYLKWGWLQISVSNLIVIILMLTIFTLAIVIPFPSHKDDQKSGQK
jgi:hypothetical protein